MDETVVAPDAVTVEASPGGSSELGSLASVLGALAATPPAERAALVRGTLIDEQYRIVGALGEGGMGVVYRARDLRLDREVAIKVGTTSSAASLARAGREAIALARLAHPNVVVVYQVGEVGGRLYIAMEQVAGETVDARADQFAFCVALWDTLFGARPFAGKTPVELAVAIESGPGAPPTERARLVPRHVVAALQRGLRAARDERWPALAPL